MRQPVDWIITDTHWYHDAVIEWCGRPPDYNERLIKNCRHLVAEQDRLIHLGDVIFQYHGKLAEILESIPGKKILVKGNHDRKSDSWYYRHGFSFVCDYAVINNVLLSHKPKVIPEDVLMNIHGHFHNSDYRKNEPEFQKILEKRHCLLAVEFTNYKPINLQSWIDIFNSRSELMPPV